MSNHAEKPLDLQHRLVLSVEEAADALGISERHLRAVLAEIPHTHLGRRIVIPVESLRAWLQERAQAEGRQADRVVREELRALGTRQEVVDARRQRGDLPSSTGSAGSSAAT